MGSWGPPWQADRRTDALATFEVLPDHAREIVLATRAELVTAKDPYFRGINADAGSLEGMSVMPGRSTEPKIPRSWSKRSSGKNLSPLLCVRQKSSDGRDHADPGLPVGPGSPRPGPRTEA
jgi:hypothetical protein